jgi:hypothetical protein
MRAVWVVFAVVAAALVVTGCHHTHEAPDNDNGKQPDAHAENQVKAAEAAAPGIPSAGFDKGEYVTLMHEGRVWVFAKGSDDLKSFLAGNEPAKNVSLPKAGPGGYTLRSTELSTLQGYLAARDGFVTELVEGRIWVFRPGSEDFATFRRTGEPAKYVIRPAAGPLRMTVKAPDDGTMADYLRMAVN